MKYIYISFFLFFSSVLYAQNAYNSVDSVDITNKRKFDYFFLEALHERLSGNYANAFNYYKECLKINYDCPTILYELSKLMLMQNQYNEAETLLKHAVELEPNNIWYLTLLADIYNHKENIEESIKIYDRLVSISPDNKNYMYVLFVLHKENKDYKKALAFLDKFQLSVGFDDFFYVERSELYRLMGNKKQALKILQKLQSEYPLEPRYMAYLGNYYQKIDNIELAKLWYSKAVNSGSQGLVYNFDLGNLSLLNNSLSDFFEYYSKAVSSTSIDCQIKSQKLYPFVSDTSFIRVNFDSVVTLLNTFSKVNYDDPRPYSFLGYVYSSRNKNIDAQNSFKTAANLDHSDDILWFKFLDILSKNSSYDELEQYGKQAIEYFPDNSYFMLLYSSALINKHKYIESISVLSTADSISDNREVQLKSFILNSLAECQNQIGDSLACFATYDKLLSINPNDLMALNNYSYFLSLIDKDLNKAVKMSQKCIEFEPQNATYLDTYAWILFKLGRFMEAKFIIERALDNMLSPDSTIYEHYGDILYFNNDINTAVEMWKKSLELNPTSEILKQKITSKSFIFK